MKTDQSCCQAKELQLEQSEEPGWSIKVDNTKVSKRFITSDMSIFMTVLGKWDPMVDFYLFQFNVVNFANSPSQGLCRTWKITVCLVSLALKSLAKSFLRI